MTVVAQVVGMACGAGGDVLRLAEVFGEECLSLVRAGIWHRKKIFDLNERYVRVNEETKT